MENKDDKREYEVISNLIEEYGAVYLFDKILNYKKNSIGSFLTNSLSSKIEKEFDSEMIGDHLGIKNVQPIHGEWYTPVTMKDVFNDFHESRINEMKTMMREKISENHPEIATCSEDELKGKVSKLVADIKATLLITDLVDSKGVLKYKNIEEVDKKRFCETRRNKLK
jgi:hypothetical protein